MANQRAYYCHSAHGVQAARLTQGRRRQQSPNATKPRKEKHNADGKRNLRVQERTPTKVCQDEEASSNSYRHEKGREEA
tara:strand:- start:2254 stop:2490 length:237 start_codon:yes stop_codon:yes gene_type:complete